MSVRSVTVISFECNFAKYNAGDLLEILTGTSIPSAHNVVSDKQQINQSALVAGTSRWSRIRMSVIRKHVGGDSFHANLLHRL